MLHLFQSLLEKTIAYESLLLSQIMARSIYFAPTFPRLSNTKIPAERLSVSPGNRLCVRADTLCSTSFVSSNTPTARTVCFFMHQCSTSSTRHRRLQPQTWLCDMESCGSDSQPAMLFLRSRENTIAFLFARFWTTKKTHVF